MLLLLTVGAARAQLSLPPDYAWRQLSPPGEVGSSVRSLWKIDPRGEWVVFVGDVENAGAEAVYAMRRNGAALYRLSAYGAPGSIAELLLSGDGRRVFYLGDLETDGRNELWSAPIPGTPASAVKLNVAVQGQGVEHWSVPASGERLVYAAEGVEEYGFWSVPLAGPAAASVRLDPGLTPGESFVGTAISPEGARAFLVLGDIAGQTSRIWSAPIDGPIGSGLFLFDESSTSCFATGGAVPSGSSRFFYLLSCDTPSGNRINQAWSVPLAGPAAAAVSLAGSFVAGGAIASAAFSSDGEFFVFRADKSVDDQFDLWSVPLAGPLAELVRLNPLLVGSGDVTSRYTISPDSSRVAYVADQTTDETFRAWSVPISGPSGSATSLVSGILPLNRDVTSLEFTPDSATVVFRADFAEDERFDLYSVPADGSAFQDQITNDSSVPGPIRAVGSSWRLHPDGARVAYIFDESAPGDSRGLGEQRLSPRYIQDAQLNGDPVAGGRIFSFAVFPDSAGTIYFSDELIDERWHLFTVDSRIFGDGFEEGTTAAWPDAP